MKKLILTMAAAMVLVPSFGGVRVFVGGPAFFAPGPFWAGYWGPGPYYYGYANAGEVKLDTKVKDAQVFINGSYAGLTKDNKTMHLRPGNYKIEIREGNQTAFVEDVYVVAGKTIHIQPAL